MKQQIVIKTVKNADNYGRDNETNRWKRNAKNNKRKQRKTERDKGNRSYSERVRAKWFCCAFKLGFLQLICKGSLIFNSNLELALSIILKQRIIWIKACCGEVQMFKNMRRVILFDMLLNPSFKMTTSFVNIARTTASTRKSIY